MDKHILAPLPGGIKDKVRLRLRYTKPFPPPDSFGEVQLILTNKTDSRIQGYSTIQPPADWTIMPGERLMVAVRPRGTVAAEFYLSIPMLPGSDPQILTIRLTEKAGLTALAYFDLRDGLLFLL